MSEINKRLSILKQFLDPCLIDQAEGNQFVRRVIEIQFKDLFENIDSSKEEQVLFNYVLKRCVQISDEIELDISAGKKQLYSLLQTLRMEEEIIFYVFYTLLSLFLKENWTGPSFLSADSIKKIKKEKQSANQVLLQKTYPSYDFSGLQKKYASLSIPADLNTYNYKFIKTPYYMHRFEASLIDHLEVDSENWPRRMPLSHLFIILKEIINFLVENDKSNPIYALYLARVNFIHSQMLYFPTGTLFPQVIEKYQLFFTLLKTNALKLPRQVLSNLYIENSHSLLFFYKYSASKKCLSIAQELLKIEFSLTGRMGKRTKYQTFNTCQLVVQAYEKGDHEETPSLVSQEDKNLIEEENKDKVNAQELVKEMQLQISPQNMQLDEECVLLEKPVIDETDDFNKNAVVIKDEKSTLNLSEQILVLGLMKYQEISNPHDEIYHEYIQSYCNFLIDKSLNWMVFSTSLLYRSLNEYVRYKKMERALLQMQTLVDQYNDPLPNQWERMMYLFSLNYPHYFDLQKSLAEKYMKVGIVMSGNQIFERLGMFEECIECLQSAGHNDRAKKLAEQHLPNATPKLLCIYGELTRDIKYFKQAWKLSKKKFARAQRSLGKSYFHSNLLQKSINAFKKAVSINKYNQGPWFTMGCAYIRLNDLQNASQCFSTCVSISESDGESWANLSSCFMKMGRKQEALSTLEQATKYCERNWRIWQNLLYVSLSNQKFYKYFECIEKLIALNQKTIIDEEAVAKLIQIFKFKISEYTKTDYKHPFLTYRNRYIIGSRLLTYYWISVIDLHLYNFQRIERMFNLLQLEMGEKYYVWKSWAEFVEVDIDFQELQTEFLVEQRRKRREEVEKGIVHENTLISYFGEDPNMTEQELEEGLTLKRKELLNRAADLRMKTCQILQIVGWQHEKQTHSKGLFLYKRKQCELMYENTTLLVEAYKKIKGEDAMKELAMYIKSIKNLIEENLEKVTHFNI